MRRIDSIIIHCSATRAGKDFTATDIDRWHKEMGYSGIGYHFVIRLNGKVEAGRDVAKVGAHCKGHNTGSIGICYVGGLDSGGRAKDTRTDEQRKALRELVGDLCVKYGISTQSVHGHNEFAAKDCPCFDVSKEVWHIDAKCSRA